MVRSSLAMVLRLRGNVEARDGLSFRVVHIKANGYSYWEDTCFFRFRQAYIICLARQLVAEPGEIVKVEEQPDNCG